MTLRFTGEREPQGGESVVHYRALDGDKKVTVVMSVEALEDHGERDCEDKAFDKYAAGLIEGDSTVRVFNIDFLPEPRPGEENPTPEPPERRVPRKDGR